MQLCTQIAYGEIKDYLVIFYSFICLNILKYYQKNLLYVRYGILTQQEILGISLYKQAIYEIFYW